MRKIIAGVLLVALLVPGASANFDYYEFQQVVDYDTMASILMDAPSVQAVNQSVSHSAFIRLFSLSDGFENMGNISMYWHPPTTYPGTGVSIPGYYNPVLSLSTVPALRNYSSNSFGYFVSYHTTRAVIPSTLNGEDYSFSGGVYFSNNSSVSAGTPYHNYALLDMNISSFGSFTSFSLSGASRAVYYSEQPSGSYVAVPVTLVVNGADVATFNPSPSNSGFFDFANYVYNGVVPITSIQFRFGESSEVVNPGTTNVAMKAKFDVSAGVSNVVGLNLYSSSSNPVVFTAFNSDSTYTLYESVYTGFLKNADGTMASVVNMSQADLDAHMNNTLSALNLFSGSVFRGDSQQAMNNVSTAYLLGQILNDLNLQSKYVAGLDKSTAFTILSQDVKSSSSVKVDNLLDALSFMGSELQNPLQRLAFVFANPQDLEMRENVSEETTAVDDNFFKPGSAGKVDKNNIGDAASFVSTSRDMLKSDASASDAFQVVSSSYGFWTQQTADDLDNVGLPVPLSDDVDNDWWTDYSLDDDGYYQFYDPDAFTRFFLERR